jgi:uncharacterized protein
LTVAATPALAQRAGIEQLFPEQPTGYVTDVAHVVPADRLAAIEDVIDRLRRSTGAEIAVVTLPTIGQYDRADVAVAIGRKWGVGAAAEQGDARRNAGIVVLVVPRQSGQPGRLFIATGRGVEGSVTDLVAGRIVDQMRPYLSAGDYGQGIEVGVRSLASVVARGFGITDTSLVRDDRSIYRPDRETGRSQGIPSWVIILIVLVVLISLSGGGRGGRRRRGGWFIFPGGFGGGGWGGGGFGGWGGGGGGGGGFGGFGGGGGFSGGGSGGDF